jgi:hypothetical protein
MKATTILNYFAVMHRFFNLTNPREWFNNKVTFMLLLNMRVGAIFDCT